ncbi:RDD family protein [Piscibacillus halophilus]|uniref:RDD family protein n=1 Tax=Piscibacillus halophilus TaxID=571933 RepID=A0A1H9EXS6_9BACI|nr:RDD family protein [Piscibacillus halophilus]SEQ30451.1 RDD family protein [Piscibacillus halophilus]
MQSVAIRKRRFMALLIDWLYISAYLILLFGVMQIVYWLAFNGIPTFSYLQSQLIATFTSVIPVIIIFSIMEGSFQAATFGKRFNHLRISYPNHFKSRSVIRNMVKFLPWQLGHMGVIHGMYKDFNWFAMTLIYVSMLLAVLYIMMVLIRQDQRHLPDLLAGTFVEKSS